MKKVNIFVGRFQPFTAGHYKCVLEAKQKTGLPTVICMINVSEAKVDKKHPFTTEMLVNLYSDLFAGNKDIAGVVPVINADIIKISGILKGMGYEIASWTCGTDRYNSYSAMATKYHDRAELSDDFQMIEVKRDESSPDNISATMVRNSLLNNDRVEFNRLTPVGANKDVLFMALQSQIYKVYGIQEKYHRLNRCFALEERVARLEKMIRNEMFNRCYHR